MLDKNTLDKPIVDKMILDEVLFSRPTYISMLFLSSLVKLLQDAYIIFQQGTGKFEIEHKNANFWLGM